MSIIISKNGKNAIKIEKIGFNQELEIQKYIYDNPESIPIEEIKDGVTFFIADREFPTNSGPIDALGFDSEGNIYIIETKLFKNPDKRKVLAQVLDYGASLWDFSRNPDEFFDFLKQRFKLKNNIELEEKFIDKFSESDDIIANIKINLIEGNFNFLILMDEVHSSLKNLTYFINQNSQFSIFLVELEYYTHENYEIIIPHVFGTETKKRVVSVSQNKVKMDETSFFHELEKELGNNEANVARKILEWAKNNNFIIKWPGISLGLEINHNNINYKLLKIYKDGSLELSFAYLKKSPPFNDDAKRLELLHQFNQIQNFNLTDDKIHARPGDGLSISMLKNNSNLQKFISSLEWFLQEIFTQ